MEGKVTGDKQCFKLNANISNKVIDLVKAMDSIIIKNSSSLSTYRTKTTQLFPLAIE